MKNSELIVLLKSFDKKELKQLDKYIRSPFFNENPKLIELFEYLMQFAPKYNSPYLERTVIFEAFFPDKDYQKNKGLDLRRLISQLNKLVEAFIDYVMINQKKHQSILKAYSLDYYKKRGLDKHYVKLSQYLDKEKKGYIDVSVEYYYRKRFASLKDYNFFSSKDLAKATNKLKNSVEYLDIFYLLTKLQSTCLILSSGRLLRIEQDQASIMDLLNNTQKSLYWKNPLIQIYFYAVSCLLEKAKEADFEQFRWLLKEHVALFPIQELRQLYVYAKNYCIQKTRQGFFEYNYTLFELIEIELEQGIIYEQGKVLDSYFRYIIRVALRLQKWDWVKQFLASHEDKILSSHPKEVFQFSQANLAYHQKDYDQVLELIKYDNFKNIIHQLSCRVLLLKVFYDTEELDLLEANINSLKTFLYRNKLISTRQQNQYKNFANMLHQIQNTAPKQSERIDKLLQKIDDTKELSQRNWLKEKLEELR